MLIKFINIVISVQKECKEKEKSLRFSAQNKGFMSIFVKNAHKKWTLSSPLQNQKVLFILFLLLVVYMSTFCCDCVVAVYTFNSLRLVLFYQTKNTKIPLVIT